MRDKTFLIKFTLFYTEILKEKTFFMSIKDSTLPDDIDALRNILNNEIRDIESMKEKVKDISELIVEENPFILERLNETPEPCTVTLNESIKYNTEIVDFCFIPQSKRLAIGSPNEIIIYSIPMVSSPNKISFNDPNERLKAFITTAHNFAVVAHFTTGEVKPFFMSSSVWVQPLLTGCMDKVIMKSSNNAVVIYHPSSGLFVFTPQMEFTYKYEIKVPIYEIELSPNGLFIALYVGLEIWLFSLKTFKVEGILKNTTLQLCFSYPGDILYMRNEASIGIADVCAGYEVESLPLRSYSFSSVGKYFVAIENTGEGNENDGRAIIYTVVENKHVAVASLRLREEKFIQVHSYCDSSVSELLFVTNEGVLYLFRIQ